MAKEKGFFVEEGIEVELIDMAVHESLYAGLFAGQVRGIGHPVATYRVVDLYAAEGAERIRSDLPHLKLDADPELMSAEERRQAAALLQKALQRLGPTPVAPQAKAETSTEPTAPSGPCRHVRNA